MNDNKKNLILSKLTCRLLTIDDLPKYIEFYNSFQTFMKFPKLELGNKIIETFSDSNRKHVGVFDEHGEFLSVITGYYPDKYMFWYVLQNYTQSNNNSLTSYMNFGAVFNRSIQLLIDHGESIGYYGFYNRRTIDHQKKYERLLDVGTKKWNETYRYDIYYEHIYGPDVSTTDIMNHKVYFSNGTVINSATIICLNLLKQKYRKELLSIKYPEL